MCGGFESGHGCRHVAVSVPLQALTDRPLLQLMYIVNDKLPCNSCVYYSKRLIEMYYLPESRSTGSPEASDCRDDTNRSVRVVVVSQVSSHPDEVTDRTAVSSPCVLSRFNHQGFVMMVDAGRKKTIRQPEGLIKFYLAGFFYTYKIKQASLSIQDT